MVCHNKLSINFGDDKTKSIIFASKQRAKNVRQLNRYKNKYKAARASYISWMCVRQCSYLATF